MRIYPTPGLLLRDPVKGDMIPAAGRDVDDSPFWRRRIRCGDASLTPPAAAPVAAVAVVEPVDEPLIDEVDENALASAERADTPTADADADAFANQEAE